MQGVLAHRARQCRSNTQRTEADSGKEFPLPSEHDLVSTGGPKHDENRNGHHNFKPV